MAETRVRIPVAVLPRAQKAPVSGGVRVFWGAPEARPAGCRAADALLVGRELRACEAPLDLTAPRGVLQPS
jgi:hypothetical protein